MEDLMSRIERRGGARLGAGTKPAGYVKPEELRRLDTAKAAKEEILVQKHALDLKVKTGQYISRVLVQEGSAVLLASVAQTLRALPDLLERKHDLTPRQAQAVEETIDNVLAELAAGLQKLPSQAMVNTEDDLGLPHDEQS